MKKLYYLLLVMMIFSCATQTKTMKNELKILDKALKAKRPDYYAQLQAPLNVEEILALETKYNIKLPEDLKALYLWKNGQKYDCYKTFVNNSMFEPLEDALYNAEESSGMIGYDFLFENWWNKHWLPIFSNGGGDSICYDLEGTFTGKSGQLIEFWHTDADRAVITPDLLTFIKALNVYYKKTDSSDFDGLFNVSESITDFRKRFIAHKPIIKNK